MPIANRQSPASVPDGVLVVDKPSGPTSHDVVARARTALKERRIGHTGTLDPLATGVLPLVIGRATRLAQFLSAGAKTYDATVRLGVETDTYDGAGRVVAEHPVDADAVTAERLEQCLAAFRGTHAQAPPPYSAKKVGGVRAYELARKSEAVALDPVTMTVHDLHLLGVEGETLRLRVTASAGFYVRTLAHDLGAALGTGGCLTALRRIRSGDFGLDQAVPLDDIERSPAAAAALVIPLDSLLTAMPSIRLTPDGCRRAAHGAPIRAEDLVPPSATSHELVRLLDAGGHLLAVARRPRGGATLHPLVVLG